MEKQDIAMAPLFKGLATEDIERVLSSVPYRIRKYRAGTIIYHSGDPVEAFIMVIKGTVKGEMTDFSGRVIKIEDISAPQAVAPAFLFGSKNRFPVNVVALTDAGLLIIEKKSLLRLLMSNDMILVNFLGMISSRSQFLSEKIKFLNFKTIKEKLAQFILQRAGGSRNEIELDKTQGELAEFFGVARPSIARAIGELEDEGFILARGKHIRILDKARLAELTCD